MNSMKWLIFLSRHQALKPLLGLTNLSSVEMGGKKPKTMQNEVKISETFCLTFNKISYGPVDGFKKNSLQVIIGCTSTTSYLWSNSNSRCKQLAL